MTNDWNPTLKCFDDDMLRNLAQVGNSDCREEYRRRNCSTRGDAEPPENCDCWACERYGIDGYHDFTCHPDGDYGQLLHGECWCWACDMRREAKE